MTVVHIDLETYSSVDIKTSGMYKYTESPDFEILMIAYSINDNPIRMVSLAEGDKIPKELDLALKNPKSKLVAHNAAFERNALKQYGYVTNIEQWTCTAVLSSYAGLPLSLEKVSEALKLESDGKLSTGKALIRFFCVPCKPTKVNGMKHRNYWHDDLEKWEMFKQYCINDVVAEKRIYHDLEGVDLTDFERDNYLLDQKINDRGVLVDLGLVENAIEIDTRFTKEAKDRLGKITGLDNPNSPVQLKGWIGQAMKKEITSLAKPDIPGLMEEAGPGAVTEALKLRLLLSKTSVKKYAAMQNCVGWDNRIRGLLQFYGAGRTGRWAGRLVQVQNLPRNYMETLDEARDLVSQNDYDALTLIYESVPDVLSQLIRTAFVAPEGHTFAVCDFSAIEARVLAWLAGEEWRLEVFRTHGKIYEASAAMMFKVPIESIGKGSDLRQKGKVAELALGYQGGVGAMINMGGEKMGLSEPEMKRIVDNWREANPNVSKLWSDLNSSSVRCVSLKKEITARCGLIFRCENNAMTIELPSGKKLYYRSPEVFTNQYGTSCVRYKGMIQEINSYGWIRTYGGKLAENVVQAISRDLLADCMLRLDRLGFKIVKHIHDEVVAEVPMSSSEKALEMMEACMGEPIPWAKGLPLKGDGYLTRYYKKD